MNEYSAMVELTESELDAVSAGQNSQGPGTGQGGGVGLGGLIGAGVGVGIGNVNVDLIDDVNILNDAQIPVGVAVALLGVTVQEVRAIRNQ